MGFFSAFQLFDVPLLSRNIPRSSSIEVYVWNGVDSSLIEANILIFISEINNPQIVGSIPIQSSEIDTSNLATESSTIKNNPIFWTEVTGHGTKTSGDGGSEIVSTIYTCPVGKIAIIKVVHTRVRSSGSGTQIRLLLRGQRMAVWKLDNNNPDDYNTSSGTFKPTITSSDARKIWSDGNYPEHNLLRSDLQDQTLQAGQTVSYDRDFRSRFNASVDYAFTVYERDV